MADTITANERECGGYGLHREPAHTALEALIFASGHTEADAKQIMHRLAAIGYVIAPREANETMFMHGGDTDVSNQPPRAWRRRIGDEAARQAWATMVAKLIEQQEAGFA